MSTSQLPLFNASPGSSQQNRSLALTLQRRGLVHSEAAKPKWKIKNIAKAMGTQTHDQQESHHGKITCNASVTGIASPKECPDECPFLKYSRHGYCAFYCVTAHDCPLVGDPISSFADEKLGLCRTCEVIGCDVCGSSEFHCFKC